MLRDGLLVMSAGDDDCIADPRGERVSLVMVAEREPERGGGLVEVDASDSFPSDRSLTPGKGCVPASVPAFLRLLELATSGFRRT